MSADRKVPEIRFKGYSGEWQEKKLGELAEILRGASPRPIEDPKWFDSNSNVGWLRIRDVTEQDGRISYLEHRISKLGQEKTRVLHTKSLLLSIAASVGKPVINYVETGVHDGFLIFKKPFFELEFMYQWLKSFEEKWKQYGQPGSQVNLNSDIVKNQNVTIPTKEEQIQIGDYFQKLDTLINQHQNKHDKLCNIKKAMLEKMFPKQGETIPEIRFKGFSGEWVKKTLSETAPLRGGFAFQSLKFCDNGIPIVKISNILSTGEVGGEFSYYKEISNDENYLLLDGAALLAMSGATTGKVSVLKCHSGAKFYQNQRVGYFQRNADFDYLFISTLVRSKIFRNKLDAVLIAGAQPNVSSKEIDSFEFMMPNDIKEQLSIGNYFQKLDNLINQHQQQITKLKNIKQACLSKMFV